METPNEISEPTIEKIQRSKQTLDVYMTSFIVNSSIENLLSLSFEQIKNKQLITFTSAYSHIDIMTLLNHYIYHASPTFGTSQPSGLYEEDSSDIIKIQKDNLSPKQLPSQHPEKDQQVKELPENLSSCGSKRLNMTNRSSFTKRKSSQMSQLPSGTVTQRSKLPSNISFKSNNPSPQKLQKSVSNKKDPLQNFTLIMTSQSEDPEIIFLRQKVQFKQKEKEKQQKLYNERQKEDQQKLQSFNSQYGAKSSFTFGFEGQTLGSQTAHDQKINYYAMKVGVKTMGNKYRTIYRNLQTMDKNQQNQETITKNRLSQNRKSSLETSNILNASFEIPVFQKQANTFAQEVDPARLKIIEYKRLYGKKFSRYDKNSMTLDLSSVVDKKLVEEDFFGSKKHLTDSISVNKSRSSSVNREHISRKLALPKLKGVYKVLDRYQEL